MNKELIIIVEDETDIREVLEYNLEREGYKVLTAADGKQGLELIQKTPPTLVLLDLMLPKIDGLEVCKRLKDDTETASIPLIMVTAKGEESDIILGLELGADDYMVKPFSPKELLARIRAVIRRRGLQDEGIMRRHIERDGVVMDMERHEVMVDHTSVSFTASELKLLYYLASHPGRVFTRDRLLSQMVGRDEFIVDRNIDVHIQSVRKKLGHYRYLIETIRGVGYRFKDEERT
ncbi:MAG: response regulator [Pseudomonadota bacterium]|nr:response regulator [Pseudomonadota bacterium]